MCIPKAPKINTPPPPPTMEQARTDDVAVARANERKRQKNAMNAQTSILSQGGGSGRNVSVLRKLFLGE